MKNRNKAPTVDQCAPQELDETELESVHGGAVKPLHNSRFSARQNGPSKILPTEELFGAYNFLLE